MATARLISYLSNVPPEGERRFPPESVFIYPPLVFPSCDERSLLLGDFLEKVEDANSKSIWVVASPSCDLVFAREREAKADQVLVLRCYRSYQEVPFLRDKTSEGKRKDTLSKRLGKTVKILKCSQGIFGCSYILVCFKHYRTIPYEDIKRGIQEKTWYKLATLATPYAESLQNLFIRDLSRIGTPETGLLEEEIKWMKEFVKG